MVTETMRLAKRQRTWFGTSAGRGVVHACRRGACRVLRWLEEAPAEGRGGAGAHPELTGRRGSYNLKVYGRPDAAHRHPRIPPEGLEIDEALEPAAVHLDGDEELSLRPGGRLRGTSSSWTAPPCTCGPPRRRGGDRLRAVPRAVRGGASPGAGPLLPAARAEQPEAEEEEVELSDRDVVVGYYEGDHLDLGRS